VHENAELRAWNDDLGRVKVILKQEEPSDIL
jgi:hypothetical protein